MSSFMVLTVRETDGQRERWPNRPRAKLRHYVRCHDSQNGKTLFSTQNYANRSSAKRAARNLEDRLSGGVAVLVPGTFLPNGEQVYR